MIEDDITVPIFHYSFYRGNFYLGYKLAMNLAGLLLIAGVLMAFYRRLVVRPKHAGHERGRSRLARLPRHSHRAGVSCSARSVSAVQRDPWAAWSFVSYALAIPLRGLSDGWLKALHQVNWFSHFLTTFAFLAYFAYSKMIHPFTSLANVFFRRLKPTRRTGRRSRIWRRRNRSASPNWKTSPGRN